MFLGSRAEGLSSQPLIKRLKYRAVELSTHFQYVRFFQYLGTLLVVSGGSGGQWAVVTWPQCAVDSVSVCKVWVDGWRGGGVGGQCACVSGNTCPPPAAATAATAPRRPPDPVSTTLRSIVTVTLTSINVKNNATIFNLVRLGLV